MLAGGGGGHHRLYIVIYSVQKKKAGVKRGLRLNGGLLSSILLLNCKIMTQKNQGYESLFNISRFYFTLQVWIAVVLFFFKLCITIAILYNIFQTSTYFRSTACKSFGIKKHALLGALDRFHGHYEISLLFVKPEIWKQRIILLSDKYYS